MVVVVVVVLVLVLFGWLDTRPPANAMPLVLQIAVLVEHRNACRGPS